MISTYKQAKGQPRHASLGVKVREMRTVSVSSQSTTDIWYLADPRPSPDVKTPT
jgi:hypothetical protein